MQICMYVVIRQQQLITTKLRGTNGRYVFASTCSLKGCAYFSRMRFFFNFSLNLQTYAGSSLIYYIYVCMCMFMHVYCGAVVSHKLKIFKYFISYIIFCCSNCLIYIFIATILYLYLYFINFFSLPFFMFSYIYLFFCFI